MRKLLASLLLLVSSTVLGQVDGDLYLQYYTTTIGKRIQPLTILGHGGKALRVKMDGTGLELYTPGGGGASAFTSLSDVPSSYTGHALNVVRVNGLATGLEFGPVLGTAATKSTSIGGNLSADAGKLLEFNTGGQIQGSSTNESLAAVTGDTQNGTGVRGQAQGGTAGEFLGNTGHGVIANSSTGIGAEVSNNSTTQPALHVRNFNPADLAPLAHFEAQDGLGMQVLNDGSLDWTSAAGASGTRTNLGLGSLAVLNTWTLQDAVTAGGSVSSGTITMGGGTGMVFDYNAALALRASSGGFGVVHRGPPSSSSGKYIDWRDIPGTGALLSDIPVSGVGGYQPYDADLDDLADGSLSGSKVGTGIDAANLSTGTIPAGRFNSPLRALAAATNSADLLPYFDGTTTAPTTTLTSFMRSVLAAVDASAARTTLGLVIGTNVQAYDADLDDLADGSLSGSKVGSGINASNVTNGTLPIGQHPAMSGGDVTSSAGSGNLQIGAGVIVDADVNGSAAIAGSKIQASSGSNAGTMSAAHYTKVEGLPTRVYKTATETRTTNTVLAADNTLKVTLAASQRIHFKVWMQYVSTGTGGIKLRTYGPASPTFVFVGRDGSQFSTPPAGSNFRGTDNAYSSADITFTATAGQIGYITFEGTIINGANAGDFGINWAQNSSNLSTTVYIGSYIEYQNF